MRHSSPTLILLATTLCAVCAGCSPLAFLFPEKPVYVPPGVMVELAKDCRLDCWVTNAKTGERERRVMDAQAGWMVVRPRCDFEPAEPRAPQAVPRSWSPWFAPVPLIRAP